MMNASSLNNSALQVVLESQFFDPLFAWDVALDAGSIVVPSCTHPHRISAPKDEKKEDFLWKRPCKSSIDNSWHWKGGGAGTIGTHRQGLPELPTKAPSGGIGSRKNLALQNNVQDTVSRPLCFDHLLGTEYWVCITLCSRLTQVW